MHCQGIRKDVYKRQVQKYHLDPKLAGTMPGLLPIGAIIVTPLFGCLYDRIGKGATLMVDVYKRQEPSFRIMYTSPKDYDSTLKLIRNIIIVDIKDKMCIRDSTNRGPFDLMFCNVAILINTIYVYYYFFPLSF